MVFCVLLSFFAFAVGPRIGYARETIEHVGLMIALWAPTLGILGYGLNFYNDEDRIC